MLGKTYGLRVVGWKGGGMGIPSKATMINQPALGPFSTHLNRSFFWARVNYVPGVIYANLDEWVWKENGQFNVNSPLSRMLLQILHEFFVKERM